MKKIMLFLTALLLVGLLAACGDEEETDAAPEKEATVDTIEDGYFTFGSSGLYKPFNFEDLDGDLTGFEVELGEAIAKEMGLKPKPVATQDFGALIEEVNSGRLDAIMGSMTITEKRAESVDFSDPYYRSGGVIYVHNDNDSIEAAEDLEGHSVGVVASSTYEEMVMDYITEEDLKTYQSDNVALQDLAAGTDRLDAVVTDKFVGMLQIEENDLDIRPVGDRVFDEEIGAAVKKGNQELLDEINRALQAVIDDGTYDEISKKWFDENILE
ncbi:putative amino-acid-binding protein YxeM [Lentibacillus sp. JNUCC-1]|uniref:transporter substrate-binding domain-containing protein n=1 Tax=Lentibacillus sp. JNUCC-1 TaxID=2654513 RepID=UPI0012E76832|nr:transporter substrate-binding domain-containing protein [Lentibacillus sp. JNUCC-1]MUV38915.1 putative amino-acid-binding protein YxeM [Lentibacillus sp. JNUCC-1]